MQMVKKRRGFSLIELLIVVAIILIIAAIAIPNLLRSRMQASQAAAVSTLRNINNSQAAYLAQFGGTVGYANSMAKLGQSAACDQNAACLVDEVLGCAAAPCVKGGYEYFLSSSVAAPPFTDYTSTATPIALGRSGQINYCSIEDAVLRQEISSTTAGSAIPRAGCVDTTRFLPLNH
ncbi:MAG TPA: prepilin-type N-terminal cleavage/methylation domain-containing protein [Candidatus Angelobacter sp.]|jgi:prepilin-type N-terminal cleavage/methylation domain-containing protein